MVASRVMGTGMLQWPREEAGQCPPSEGPHDVSTLEE